MTSPGDESKDDLPASIEAGNTAQRPIKADPKLLELLVCPITRVPLEYDAIHQELISRRARLAYPIRDGIPIMLPEEARILPD